MRLAQLRAACLPGVIAEGHGKGGGGGRKAGQPADHARQLVGVIEADVKEQNCEAQEEYGGQHDQQPLKSPPVHRHAIMPEGTRGPPGTTAHLTWAYWEVRG